MPHSIVERSDGSWQPSTWQITGALLLALFSGVITFTATCFGAGFFAVTVTDLRYPGAALLVAVVSGGAAGIYAVLRTYKSVLQHWSRYRTRTAAPQKPS